MRRLATFAFAVLAGCSTLDLTTERQYPCDSDGGHDQPAKCANGWQCYRDGYCHPPGVGVPLECRDESDCPGGWHCGVEGRCYDRDAGTDVACRRDAGVEDCAPGWTCGLALTCLDQAKGAPVECARESDCPGGWHCGVDGRCYDRAAAGPVGCRRDAGLDDCAPGWRCGLELTCHDRDAGADYRCAADLDCEQGFRCGPDGRCLDARAEALAPTPPDTAFHGRRVHPEFLDGPHIDAVGGLFESQSSGMSYAVQQLGLLRGQDLTFYDFGGVSFRQSVQHFAAPLTALSFGPGYAVAALDGGLWSASSGSFVSNEPVTRLSSTGVGQFGGIGLTQRFTVASGGQRVVGLRGKDVLFTVDGPAGATLLQVVAVNGSSSNNNSQYSMIALTTQGVFWASYDDVGGQFWLPNGTKQQTVAWSPLARTGLPAPGCGDSSAPTVAMLGASEGASAPARLHFVTPQGVYGFAELDVPGTPPGGQCLGGKGSTVPLGGWCTPGEVVGFWREGPLCRRADAGVTLTALRVNTRVDGLELSRQDTAAGEVLYDTDATASGVIGLGLTRLDLLNGALSFSLPPSFGPAVPPWPTTGQSAVVGHSDGGLVSYVSGIASGLGGPSPGPFVQRPGFGLTFRSANGDLLCTPVRGRPSQALLRSNGVLVLADLNEFRNTPGASATALAQLDSSAAYASQPCSGEQGLTVHAAAGRNGDGGTTVVIADPDLLWSTEVNAPPPDGGTHPRVPRRLNTPGTLTALAMADVAPGEPLFARGYAIAGERLYEVRAESKNRWAMVELVTPVTEPMGVWTDHSRGRALLADGTALGLPTGVVLAGPTPAAPLEVDSLCGQGVVRTAQGLLRLTAASDGGVLGTWASLPVQVPAGFSWTTARIQGEGDELFVLGAAGEIYSVRDGTCVP
ncbi:MAG: hypothetical protein K1X89_08325 [Myxococcaceae bacterium]|nr:hypothetical protein [Myxococcaceae bacterium]